jgi:hypothetical protein
MLLCYLIELYIIKCYRQKNTCSCIYWIIHLDIKVANISNVAKRKKVDKKEEMTFSFSSASLSALASALASFFSANFFSLQCHLVLCNLLSLQLLQFFQIDLLLLLLLLLLLFHPVSLQNSSTLTFTSSSALAIASFSLECFDRVGLGRGVDMGEGSDASITAEKVRGRFGKVRSF